MHTMEILRKPGWDVSDEDDRTVVQLFCDQLEFANMIVVNKTDLIDEEGRARLGAMRRQFNPFARLVEAAWCVDSAKMIGTGLSAPAPHIHGGIEQLGPSKRSVVRNGQDG